MCHVIFTTSIQVCHGTSKAAIDHTETNGCACILIKLYSQKQMPVPFASLPVLKKAVIALNLTSPLLLIY